MTPTLIIISLVLLGILMMLIEFLLTPGMGFAGIVGLASFVGACVYAFMKEGTQAGTIVTAVVAVIVVILFIWMLRGKSWKKLEQKEQIDVKTNTEVEKVSVGDKGVIKGAFGLTIQSSFSSTLKSSSHTTYPNEQIFACPYWQLAHSISKKT